MKKRILLVIVVFGLFSGSSFAQQMFQHLLGLSAYPNYTWTGTTGDGKWSTAANWSGNAVPGSGNTAHFNPAACSTNCSLNMDITVNVGGMDIQSAYGGTITQNTGVTIAVGTSGWIQAGGTFAGGDSSININGDFTVSAGSFTSTSATLTTLQNITWANSAFHDNGGTVLITAVALATRTFSLGTNTVQNFTIQANAGYDGYTFNVTGSITVLGTFLVQDLGLITAATVSGGNFYLKGDATNTVAYSKIKMKSNFYITGSANQTITGSTSGGLSNLEIASTGGTVTFASASYTNTGSYKYTSGTVVMPTNFIEIGVFGTSYNFIPSTLEFTNFELRQDCNLDGYTLNTTGAIVVNGTLSFTRPSCGSEAFLNGGQFTAKGDVSSSTNYEGSTQIKVVGSGNQTVSGSAAGYLGNVEIASTGGTVTISGTLTFRNNFTYTSGTVSATGSTVHFGGYYNTTYAITPGTLTFDNVTFDSAAYSDGNIFNLGGGTMTVAGNLAFSHTSGSIQNTINNGTITVAKNLSSTGTVGFKGNALIQLIGTGASTVSVGMLLPITSVSSMKTSATTTLAAAWNLSGAGQNMSVSTGTMNLAGYNLTVNNIFTVASGAKLICNGGSVTATTFVLDGEIYCPTTVGTTWTGLAGNNLWNDAGNWTNNAIPGLNDTAIFNSACTGANCNVTINTSISVKGVKIMGSYSGTITQGSGNTVTVGGNGWSQAAGTFAGGNSAITMNGPWVLSGGAFTSTSGLLTIARDLTFSGTGAFNANSGSVSFNAGVGGSHSLSSGTANFNNVSFDGVNSTESITGTLNVLGTLTLNDTNAGRLTTGTVSAKGDVVVSGFGKRSGSGLVKIEGSSSQTVTASAGAYIPNLEVASTGGTVSFSGTFSIDQNLTYTSGTANFGTSTFIFNPYTAGATVTITPGTLNFANVTFSGVKANFTITGTMSVSGALDFHDDYTLPGRVDTGTIEAYGNVTNSGVGKNGSVLLRLKGSSNQTLTGLSTAYFPNLEIASTGGTVTFSGTLVLTGNYTYTSGVVDAGTSTLNFNPAFAVTATVTPGAINYSNVTFSGLQSTHNISGTMNVLGTLTVADGHTNPGSLTGGVIQASGDVIFSSTGKIGTTSLKIVGSADQTITGVSTAYIPDIEFASTGGTVNFSGTLRAGRNWKWTSGSLNAGTSTVYFSSYSFGQSYTITPGTVTYNNVDILSNAGNYTFSGTMKVNGTLNLNKGNTGNYSINSGAIEVYGNVTFAWDGYIGTTAITMKGSTSTNLGTSGAPKRPSGLFTIDKSGGAQVTLGGDQIFQDPGSSLTVLNGTLDLSGYVLSVTSTLTVSSGATLNCNGGRIAYASVVNNGTINCPGFANYTFNWTGATGDGKWSTAGNWQGGVVPGANDYPLFDSAYCGSNCNVTFDTVANMKGVKINSGYTGTFTQTAGNKLTVGKRGWIQAAGTFTGAAADMEIKGSLTVTGGTFTAPSGILTLGKGLPEYGDGNGDATMMTVSGSAVFNHSNGTVSFERGIMGNTSKTATMSVDVPAGTNFYNVTAYNTVGGWADIIYFQTLNAVNVLGNFTQGNSVAGDKYAGIKGIWNIKGNLKIGASAYGRGDLDNLVLNGTGIQTYAFETGGSGAGLKIDKSSGSVTPAAGTTDLQVSNLNLNAGTFTPPTGTLTINYYPAAALTLFRVAAGTNFTASPNLVMVAGQAPLLVSATNVNFDAPSGFAVASLNAQNANDGSKIRLTAVNPMIVNGSLTFGDTPALTTAQFNLAGSWSVKGNLNIGIRSVGGAADITLSGSGAQTITQTGVAPTGNVVIANSAGVTLATAATFNSAGQTFSITSGSLNMAGFALTLKALTLSTGTSISRNAGVLTVNGSPVGAGAYGSGTIAN